MSEHDVNKAATDIPLAEAIQTIRQELQRAQSQAKNEALVFQIENVELELTVAVGRTLKGEGGIQFYVVKAGGAQESSKETTHVLKLTLSPKTRTGERIDVSSQTDEAPARE